MRCKTLISLAIAVIAGSPPQATAGGITLGTAGNFAVLAGSTVTNTGTTVINGDVGISPNSTYTGFGSVTGNYTIHANDAVAIQAQSDLTTAYNAAAAALPVTEDLSGQDLSGLTLTPGVYHFSSSAFLSSGTLTLDDQGNPNAQFIFQIGSTLITLADTKVVEINTGGLAPGSNVFWQVGSSATLNTNTSFEGNILALTSITLDTGATILDGSALARNGEVSLDGNSITISSVPEPAAITLALIGGTLLGLSAVGKRLRERRSRD